MRNQRVIRRLARDEQRCSFLRIDRLRAGNREAFLDADIFGVGAMRDATTNDAITFAKSRNPKGGSLTYTAATVPDHFELRFKWKVSKGCNSGVYYRPGQVEYQILDNVHSPYGENARQAAASIFFLHGTVQRRHETLWRVEHRAHSLQRHGDRALAQWRAGYFRSTTRIRNGRILCNCSGFAVATSTGRGGRLWLQDHGQDVWYRALRWREIPTDERLLPNPAFKPLPVTGEALAKEQARVKRMLEAKKKPR